MRLAAILAAVVAVGGCNVAKKSEAAAPTPVKEIQGTSNAADVPAKSAADATAPVAPLPDKTPPAKTPDTLSRITMPITIEEGLDRRSVIVGNYWARNGASVMLESPQCFGEKPGEPRRDVFANAASFPIESLPCDCAIPQFKAEGCYVVFWTTKPTAKAATAPAKAEK